MATRKKSSSRRYSKKANNKIARVMREAKRGTLRSGGSGKKVKSRKQAVAIALSEARREGDKVPPNPNEKSSGGRKKASSSGGRKKSSNRKKSSRARKAPARGKKSTTRRASTSRRRSSQRPAKS